MNFNPRKCPAMFASLGGVRQESEIDLYELDGRY